MTVDLDRDISAGLERIRTGVMLLKPVKLSAVVIKPAALIERSDRMIGFFEGWLLDDEQHQAMTGTPHAKLILYAAAYLCDIGLLDEKMPLIEPSSTVIINPEAEKESLHIRSAGMIRAHWQQLGISEESMAEAIAEICLRARSTQKSQAGDPVRHGRSGQPADDRTAGE